MKTRAESPAQAPALMSHQEGDVEWALRVRRGLLANEPGMGKSRSAITATSGARTLIIAPSMVVTGRTWQDELEKWADDPSLYTIAPYSMLNARKKGSPQRALRPEYKQAWDAVIIDECHYTKGRTTTWTWATEQAAKPADMVLEMTGTPIPNWAHELFTLLRVIHGPEEAKPGGAYGSFWRWAERWFDCSPTRFSNGNPVCGELLACSKACLELPRNQPCQHYRDFTDANLGEQYRRMLRADCLDLPTLTQTTIEVPMTVAQKRVYSEMKKQYATTVSGQEVLSWSQGSLNVVIDRITTSPWLLTKEGPPRGGKLDRLAFDLAARSSPTLVFAHYNDSVEACAAVAALGGASTRVVNGRTSKTQDAESIAAFKAGKVDVLCASLEKVAESLQLTAADMVIFVEKSFKPYRNEQALYRIHRLGQTRPCTALDYVTPVSVDSRKRRLLAVKTDRQMRFMSAAEFGALL
jgi:hypothetical protein